MHIEDHRVNKQQPQELGLCLWTPSPVLFQVSQAVFFPPKTWYFPSTSIPVFDLACNVIISVEDQIVLVLLPSRILSVVLSASLHWGKDT